MQTVGGFRNSHTFKMLTPHAKSAATMTGRTNATDFRCSNCVCSSCRPTESNAALSARNRMLLRTNAPPADAQIVHIQGARNRMSKRLDVLEEQIHAYMSTLFDLQKEKTKMETALKEYKLILSRLVGCQLNSGTTYFKCARAMQRTPARLL